MRSLPLWLLPLVWAGCSDQGEMPSPGSYSDCIAVANPSPSIQSRGCGSLFVYQWLDPARAVVVSIDGGSLRLTTSCMTADLSSPPSGIDVHLEVARADSDSVYSIFCTDIAYPNQARPDVWQVTAGTLTFVVSKEAPAFGEPYRATLKLANVRFVHPATQEEAFFGELVFWNVGVGWSPG